MRRFALLGIVLLATPSLALAHVSVRPRESKAGAEERYTVRVPTEAQSRRPMSSSRFLRA
jgi:uncharacterized protein YcnI